MGLWYGRGMVVVGGVVVCEVVVSGWCLDGGSGRCRVMIGWWYGRVKLGGNTWIHIDGSYVYLS